MSNKKLVLKKITESYFILSHKMEL
jgi:hypothetical protein